MLTRIAAGRPAFSAAGKTLTFDVAALAPVKGQLLIAIAAFAAADSFAAIAGWSMLVEYAGTAKITVLARTVDDNEPDVLVLPLALATSDWLGALVLYDRGAPDIVLESSSGGDFAATLTPISTDITSQQPINLRLEVISAAGAPMLSNPSGWPQIDSYSTAIAGGRSFALFELLANGTGDMGVALGSASTPATGSTLSLMLRDQPPSTPSTLEDVLPGNIGLYGTDARPPREAGLP